jgi:predicted secreted protein
MKLLCLLIVAQFYAFPDSSLHVLNSAKIPDKTGEKILRIKKDSTVIINLKSLSTSGYKWDCSIEDSSIAEAKKKNNEFPSSRPKHVGDSGVEVFAVKGLRSGETKIHFEQRRPWKNGGKSIKNETYNVTVY